MKAVFTDKASAGSRARKSKTVSLPFSGLTVRAIILRRSDRAVLGALHRPGGKYALPGGSFKDGESEREALMRELDEEGIHLLGLDPAWPAYLGVDYYSGYNQLSLWYLLPVDGVSINQSNELLAIRWVKPDQDPWYPHMRTKILLYIQQYLPE
jgi:8-oxo-dGTP pyrophosphatase MutT (NUDIX family)